MQRFFWALGLLACGAASQASQAQAPISWHSWNDDLFQQARAEDRFVLLDLEAIWCHWCHVMDETTYQDREVGRLIGQKYIAVRVDQDSDPALSARYQDYGWPATIVLAADGTEIVKRRGYLPPEQMASMLAAIIKDPSPGPSVVAEEAVEPAHTAALDETRRQALLASYFDSYDLQYAGWGTGEKFIDADSLEYALAHAKSAPRQAAMAAKTLDAAIALTDPVWGGVYQYSERRDWQVPHFEKIMSFQTQYLRLYSEAYRVLGTARYLQVAQSIDRYVENFLTSPEGALYTSQDADVDAQLTGHMFYALGDEARRRSPNPRIDKHVYARENGWAIVALCALYDATGDARYLARARRAADWVICHRALGAGGFSHDEHARDRPALADTLAMAQGFLALYVADGDRAALAKAGAAARFIDTHFSVAAGGFASAAAAAHGHGVFSRPVRDADENIALARFANNLYRYSADPRDRRMAEHAMHYLAAPQIADGQHLRTGILLVDEELAQDPTHVTIVGHKDDKNAQALHRAALRYPALYRRIDWWDKREGAMPNPDVQYPELKQAAAFVCTGHACSLPVFDSTQLAAALDRSSVPE